MKEGDLSDDEEGLIPKGFDGGPAETCKKLVVE